MRPAAFVWYAGLSGAQISPAIGRIVDVDVSSSMTCALRKSPATFAFRDWGDATRETGCA